MIGVTDSDKLTRSLECFAEAGWRWRDHIVRAYIAYIDRSQQHHATYVVKLYAPSKVWFMRNVSTIG